MKPIIYKWGRMHNQIIRLSGEFDKPMIKPDVIELLQSDGLLGNRMTFDIKTAKKVSRGLARIVAHAEKAIRERKIK